jgi:hypothetical protein
MYPTSIPDREAKITAIAIAGEILTTLFPDYLRIKNGPVRMFENGGVGRARRVFSQPQVAACFKYSDIGASNSKSLPRL